MAIWERKKTSFGFISTRFSGLDGVSLETKNWGAVLTLKKCPVYYMAGELDTNPSTSHLVTKAHFNHKDIVEIQNAIFVRKKRTLEISKKIQRIKEELKA